MTRCPSQGQTQTGAQPRWGRGTLSGLGSAERPPGRLLCLRGRREQAERRRGTGTCSPCSPGGCPHALAGRRSFTSPSPAQSCEMERGLHPTATLPPTPRCSAQPRSPAGDGKPPCSQGWGSLGSQTRGLWGSWGWGGAAGCCLPATPQQLRSHPSPAEGLQVPAVPGQTGIWELRGCSPQPKLEQGGWGPHAPTLGCCSRPPYQTPMPPSCSPRSRSPLPTAQHISEPGTHGRADPMEHPDPLEHPDPMEHPAAPHRAQCPLLPASPFPHS